MGFPAVANSAVHKTTAAPRGTGRNINDKCPYLLCMCHTHFGSRALKFEQAGNGVDHD